MAAFSAGFVYATAERFNALVRSNANATAQRTVHDRTFKCNLRTYRHDLLLYDAFLYTTLSKEGAITTDTRVTNTRTFETASSLRRSIDGFWYPFTADLDPDNRRLIYLHEGVDLWISGSSGTGRKPHRIYSNILPRGINETGTEKGAIYSPQWSPRHDKVAFLAIEDVGLPSLKVLSLSTGRTIPVPSMGVSEFCWAPDNRHIACCAYSDYGSSDNILVIIDTDNNNSWALPYAAALAGGRKSEPQVPPPSIVWSLQTRQGNRESGPRLSSPDWSPDGKEIALVISTPSGQSVWTVTVSANRWIRYTGDYPSCRNVRWSPEGDAIGFIISSRKQDSHKSASTAWLDDPDRFPIPRGVLHVLLMKNRKQFSPAIPSNIMEFAWTA